MKKKIKDLTIAECMKFCGKQDKCENCPFYNTLCSWRFSYFEDYTNLESEVEVDEQRFRKLERS